MFHRSAVLTAVAGLLTSSGIALADAPKLSLDPTVLTPDAAAPNGLLMESLDKAGAGKTLEDARLNIYGWLETGYTYNHRHSSAPTIIIPGPFTHEIGNHYMLNQFVIRFERSVDTTKFDVGGMVELMYGSDAARIHSRGGLGFDGSDLSDDGNPDDPDSAGGSPLQIANLNPKWQFDIPQAYVDIGVPIGNGLKVRIGKFVSLMGYETIDPRGNPFYSHSYLFSAVPFTHSGILGDYKVNEQLEVQLGVSRGWDIATEDNNGATIDVIGQVAYKISPQINLAVNFSVGPENTGDSGHYRTVIDPILYWQVTDALKVGVEGLYLYDGGLNGGVLSTSTHAYGDIWGAALYAGYKINDMVTLNARLEKVHSYAGAFAGISVVDSFGLSTIPALNAYEVTLGATITPLPKDPCFKNLTIRPEIRYDMSDTSAFPFYPANSTSYKDQLTFGCDVIFTF